MRGVLGKIVREVWVGTLLFSGALLVAELLLNRILPQLLEQQAFVGLPFVKDIIGALLGVEFIGDLTAQVMQAIVWVHPVVLALLCAHATIACTRYPAGEIDRGTIDVLLALPVSRRGIYLCESLGWLVGGLLIIAGGAAGYAIGSQALKPDQRPELAVVLLILWNLACVYLAVGGLAFFVSSLSERRGRAVCVIFALVLTSILISFVAQFWEPARHFAFLSVLEYYQPATILRTGSVASRDIVMLLTAGTLGWVAGCEITARRNIATI